MLQSIRVPSNPMLPTLRFTNGGGLRPPPPAPPRPSNPLQFSFKLPFFLSWGRFASTHTSPFQTHVASIAFANGGGSRAGLLQRVRVPNPGCEHCVCKWGGGCAPNPPLSFFKGGQACFKAYESPPNPCCKNCVCKWGGAAAPPQPPRSFFCRQVLLQRIQVPSKPMLRTLRLQMGVLRPRQPPALPKHSKEPQTLNPKRKP